MRGVAVLLLLVPAVAGEDELVPVGDAITQELCEEVRDALAPRMEELLRLRFRRPVAMRIEPLLVWRAKVRQQGFMGNSISPHGTAWFSSPLDVATVVPWAIGGDPNAPQVERKTRAAWRADLEPIAADVLTRALLHQNFPYDGRLYGASLKPSPEPDEAERCAVEFLVTEGVAQLVAYRTCRGRGRIPGAELPEPGALLRAYRPDGDAPYRLKLYARGHRDGLDLVDRIALLAGMRGVRGLLYRPPPLALLVRPELLAKVELDEAPDPDTVFAVLAPEANLDVHLVDPKRADWFAPAHEPRPGCLIGYAAAVKDGPARYAFWVADPDDPGDWSGAQATALKAFHPAGATEKERPGAMPGADAVRVKILTVALEDGTTYLRAEADCLVVLAREAPPTPNLEDRVVLALRALWLRKPTPALYKEALAGLDTPDE